MILQGEDVLRIVSKYDNPVGWYPIAMTLSMKGIVLQKRLSSVLDSLVDQGYLTSIPDARFKVKHSLTQKGQQYLGK